MRLNYFQDETVWGGLRLRAQALIEHLFEVYEFEVEESDGKSSHNQPPSRPKTLKKPWSDRLLELSGPAHGSALDDKLTRFFGNIYKYQPGTNVLQLWMVCIFTPNMYFMFTYRD